MLRLLVFGLKACHLCCLTVRTHKRALHTGGAGVGTGPAEGMNSMHQFGKVRASEGLPRTQRLKIVHSWAVQGCRVKPGSGHGPALGVTFGRPQSPRMTRKLSTLQIIFPRPIRKGAGGNCRSSHEPTKV